LFFLIILTITAGHASLAPPARRPIGGHDTIHLSGIWAVSSAATLHDTGREISMPGYPTQSWMRANVPTTVLAAQVGAGQLPDPMYGMNMRNLPGGDYPYGERFANLEMPAGSPYRAGWWYRTEFSVPAEAKGKILRLHFASINYRANIWVNGQQVADSTQIAGAYRIYDLDISRAASPGKTAALAVEVFAPGPKDLGIN